jgi:hypothetical protein
MRKLMLFLTAAAAAAVGALAEPGAASADDLRAPGGGTIRALVVGVDVYWRLPASVQLQGARADAEDIAEALRRGGVKPAVLFDADVTRAKIVTQMDSFVTESKPGDFVLFTFAGHGMQTPEYPRWQGIDADGVNEQIALSGFSFSGEGVGEIIVNPEIRAWMSRLDAKGVDALVIMDSCFGGGMREVDPRTGAIRTRVLRASADQIRAGEDERGKFAGIPMTDKEARANVELMPHVTFLAGATSKSVVPETDGLASSGPRGALSYFFARALGGKSARDGVATRRALYEYLKPNVRQATQDRQLIQVEPQSLEASVYGKPVLTFAGASLPPEPAASASASTGASPPPEPAAPVSASADASASPPPEPAAPASALAGGGASPPPESNPPVSAPAGAPQTATGAAGADSVGVAIIDGSDKAWETIEKGKEPFTRSAAIDGADVVWDVGKSEALSRGDLVMQFVDGSLMGGVIDRTWMLKRLREIAENRYLSMQLASGGQLLTAGDVAKIEIDEIAGQRLVVFNIGADATVQMLYPSAPGAAGHCRDPQDNAWTCSLRVTPPFGADTIVALATSAPADDLLQRLREHHGRRDAALVPDLLTNAMKTDPAARIGFVGVYTNKHR